jgi:hypothetical protein
MGLADACRLSFHLVSSIMANVAMHALDIPSAPLEHLRLGSVRWISVLLRAGLAVAAMAAIRSPVPADTSPCSVPVRLGDGWETMGTGDASLEADALCKLLHGVAGGSDNLHSLLIARRGRIVAELYRKGQDRSARDFFSHEVREHFAKRLSRAGIPANRSL